MWRYTSVWDMINIVKANILATTLIVVSIYYSYGFDNISRSLFIIDFIFSIGLISVSRLGIRMCFSHLKDFLKIDKTIHSVKNIMLLGGGDTAQTIIRQTLQKPNGTLRVVGILDDNKKKIGQRLHGIPVLGLIRELSNFKADYDEIYICIPSANRIQMKIIIEECKKIKKPFKTLPSLSELLESKVTISHFREFSILDLLGREEVELNENSIKNLVKGKRILITGAGGSIGSELVRQCIKFQPSVLVMMDISELNLFEIERETKNLDSKTLFKPILSDIRDSLLIEQIFEEYKPQIVFHAAAYKHVPIQEIFPWEAVKTNVFGTLNLANSAIKNNVEKFVLVSTDKAVNPVNVMGATKRIAEIIMQEFNRTFRKTAFMAVRFGNVLGSSGSVIPIFKEQIRAGGPITVTDPEMERYFMSIPEASQLILQAGSLGAGGEIFILDMGSPIKIIDLANDLIRLSGFDSEDIPIKITGVRLGEKKTEELTNITENLDKTKHDKIFVLDNDYKNEIYEDVILGLKSLEKQLNERNPNKIRSILSSVLKEYKPELAIKKEAYLNEDEVKVEA